MKCHLSDAWICSTSAQTPCWVGRSLFGTCDLHLALGSSEGIKDAETGSAPEGSQRRICEIPETGITVLLPKWVCWARRMGEVTSSRTGGTVLSSEHQEISKDQNPAWLRVLEWPGHFADTHFQQAFPPGSPSCQTLMWLWLPRLCHTFTPQHWVCTHTCLAPHPPSHQPCSPAPLTVPRESCDTTPREQNSDYSAFHFFFFFSPL